MSARYPLFQDHKDFDPSHIEKGIRNVLETYPGEHMSLQGGMLRKHKILPYYEQLLKMISGLE